MIWLNGHLIEFKKFPNGETLVGNQSIEDAARNGQNKLVFKYQKNEDLIHLMFVKKHLDRIGVSHVSLLITQMPYGRMDRSEKGSVFTLKYVTEFVNELSFYDVVVIEPHSDVTTALLDNADAYMINEHLLTIVMNEVQFDLEKDYVVYPDAGAQKRYAKMFDGNTIVAHKHRDFETGQIKKLDLVGETFPASTGRKAIIVDDLSSYGGTFMFTAEKLKEKGFDEIYLLVAHAEDSIFKGRIFGEDSPITKVFTTDSLLSMPLVWTNKQYEEKIKVYQIGDFAI